MESSHNNFVFPHKSSSLFIYSNHQEEIFFFVIKDIRNIHRHVNSVISNYDVTAPCSLSRALIRDFGSILMDESFRKMQSQSKIPLDRVDYKNDQIPRLLDNPAYYDYVQMLCNNLPQYDISETAIYFLEIPFIKDIDQMLIKEENDPSYIWINADKLLESSLDESTKNQLLEVISKNHEGSITKLTNYLSLYKTKILQHPVTHLLISLIKPDFPNEKSYKYRIDGCQYEPLFYGLYRRNTDKWKFISAGYEEELPNEDSVLKNLKYVIFPGGRTSARDKSPYMKRVREWISHVYQSHNHIKILGVCLGLQVVSLSLNSTVEHATKYVDYYEDIKLNQNFYDFCKKLGIDSLIKSKYIEGKANNLVLQSHGEEVKTLNEEFLLNAGSSKSCLNEVIVDKSSRVLLIQFHPEYILEAFCNRFGYKQCLRDKDLSDENIKKALKLRYNKYCNSYKENNNGGFFREVCFYFLHS